MKKGQKFTQADYFVRNWVSAKDKNLLKTRGYVNRLSGKNRDIAISILGSKCEVCGDDNKRHLQLHHIKEIHNGGTNTKNNTRCLCANCHLDAHSKIA